jgi:phosphoserine phosphatase
MFTATFLTSPERQNLDPTLVQSLRNAWGGGDVVWLAPDIAAEFSLAAEPANFWEVWETAQSMGVDLVLQHTQGRRKKMLLADMDSTMIQQECIDELADEAGVGDHVKGITARAMNGELDFDAALRERVGLLKGLPVSVIETVLADRITLMPGGPELLGTIKANGAYAALVSGGFTAFTAAISKRLGFDENRANTLIAADGVLTGEVGVPILGKQAKVDALNEITARLGLDPSDVMAVGDGANDLGMLHKAGIGVALHAKPVVAAEVSTRINFGDLTALLYIQGYSLDEVVTA